MSVTLVDDIAQILDKPDSVKESQCRLCQARIHVRIEPEGIRYPQHFDPLAPQIVTAFPDLRESFPDVCLMSGVLIKF